MKDKPTKTRIQMHRPILLLLFCLDVANSLSTVAVTAQEYLQRHVDEHPGATRFCEIGETKRGGRGLVATRDLKANEVALRIPICCALVEPDLGQKEEENNHWAGRIAARLIDRQDRDCPHAATLPAPPLVPGRWSGECIEALEDPCFEKEIDETNDWRYKQWETHCGSHAQRDRFLDNLDLVCSRTFRCGNDLMMVPLLDMANHAPREEGGGSYFRDGSHVCFLAGNRGISRGEEITLDYGDRSSGDWLLHYGFVPDRNTADAVLLPGSKRRVSWKDVRTPDPGLRRECLSCLEERFSASLQDDLLALKQQQENTPGDIDNDDCFRMALEYRVARKTLLSAVAGLKASDARTSAFSVF